MASSLSSSIIAAAGWTIKPLSSRNFRIFAPAAITQRTGSVKATAGQAARSFSIMSNSSNNNQTVFAPHDYLSIKSYRNVSEFSARSFVYTSIRSKSTAAPAASTPATTTATVFTDTNDDGEDGGGKQYGMILDTRNMPKLKPSVIKKRLEQCKTYEGKERGIRQSPWKINRICQLAAGLTLEEALLQLQFCDLKNADLVAKVLKRTSNLADIRDGLQISQLEVAECFATKSMMLRRIKPMGRGRYVDTAGPIFNAHVCSLVCCHNRDAHCKAPCCVFSPDVSYVGYDFDDLSHLFLLSLYFYYYLAML